MGSRFVPTAGLPLGKIGWGGAGAAPSTQRQQGLTLVELLISLVLGLAVGAAVLYVYVGTVSAQNDTNTLTELEVELSAALNLMARDIRRAGYDAGGLAYAVSPKTSGTATFDSGFSIDEDHSDLGANPGCLLYTYDENGNAEVDSPDEEFGWRLKDGAVEKRKGGKSCSDSDWEDLTWTTYANIQALIFTVVPSVVEVKLTDRTVQVNTRDVHISLTGQATLRGGATVSRTLEETVRVRNDHLTQL